MPGYALLSLCPHPLHFKRHRKSSEILRAENQIAINKLLQAKTISHKKLDTKCGHLPKWAWGNMWECIAPERPYGSHKETRQCQIIYTLLKSHFLVMYIYIKVYTGICTEHFFHRMTSKQIKIRKPFEINATKPISRVINSKVHAGRKLSIKGQATSLHLTQKGVEHYLYL